MNEVMLNELPLLISFSVFSYRSHCFGMILNHVLILGRQLIQIRYSIVKRIFVNVVNDFSTLNHIIRVVFIPNKVRSENIPSLINGRIKFSFFGRNPHVRIIPAPSGFCFPATLKQGMLRTRVSFTNFVSYLFGHSPRSFIGASPGTIFRNPRAGVNAFSFFITNWANKLCFHNNYYNMKWSKTLWLG